MQITTNLPILAATHLVPNPFDPRTSGPPLSVPMDKWFPKIQSQPIWSPWTNGPHQIWSPWRNSPQKFGPHGQMVSNQFGPHISRSSQPVPLDKLNILGTIFSGGPNWLGTICPWGPNFWGPFVRGDRIGWGPFVQRDQLWGTKCLGTVCSEGPINLGPIVGDQMSGDYMCLGPNVSQPKYCE